MTNKPHPIKNKLKYALRHSRLWHTKVIKNKKKEVKNDSGFNKRSVPDGW